MDCTTRDGLVLRVQEELSKLKDIFQSSTDSQNWAKSENVCRCTDEEFNVLLQSLSPNELEAGTLILQRHIDLELQISKCLENLKSVRSGDGKKNIDVTEKLIASQSKVARLRSRLIRCITQQLHKKGSLTNHLLPWSGMEVDGSGSFDEGQPVVCVKRDEPSHQELPLTDPYDRSRETAEDENTSLYETIYPLATGSSVKAQMSTDKGGGKATFVAAEREIKDGNAALEENQKKCQLPPPKPLPYSLLKKTNPSGSGSVGEKLTEKVKVPRDVPFEEEPDAIVTEQHYLQNWDPTPVLKELFGNVRPLPPPCQHSRQEDSSSVRMAGYMEKLPVKNYQKKASVFKSWKKRYFKAMSGKLYYYEDHRSEQPLGFIDLVGCSVTCVEDKMLEVVEQSGRSLKLKCTSVQEAEDWIEALQAEAVCLLKVPSKDKSCAVQGLTVIIDLGSSTVKAGFAQEDAWPQVMFPCVIAVDKQNTDNCKFGFDALLPETRRTSTLIFPLRKSLKIDKLKFDTVDLIGILEHVFKQLQVDPSRHKVIMTLPYGAGPQEKEELVELLLDQFQVEACYLQEQAILSMYSYSAVSGIVVDIGNHIDIFPVVEGCMIESGTTRLPYGGRQITDSFTRLLTEKGLRLFSEVESYVSQAVKEKVSYVAKYSAQDDEKTSVSSAVVVDLEKYSLPDGTRNVTVDTERHRCTEGLFKPSVWGKDNPGIHELTVKAIMASGIDMRKQMCRNVYLTGGGSMSTGLAERLQAEVSALMPSSAHVQVHAGLERHHAAYIGASVVAKLPLFEELCVSKDDWDQLGPEALQKWSSI